MKESTKQRKIPFTLAKLVFCFLPYAFLGWLYEMFCVWEAGYGWFPADIDRSFLYGPFCPIYGFGALLFIVCFWKLTRLKKPLWLRILCPVFVFLGCALIATALELAGSYLLEQIGAWPMWDYSAYALNFEGRIALLPSVRFGIGGVLALYVTQPLFDWILRHLPRWLVYLLATLVLLFFLGNLYATLALPAV